MKTIKIDLKATSVDSETIESKQFNVPDNFVSTNKLQDCINSIKEGPFKGLDFQKVRGAFTVGGYDNHITILELPEIEEDLWNAGRLIRLRCPLSREERSIRRKVYFDILIQNIMKRKGVVEIN